MQERRGSADQLDAIVDPGVNRPVGGAVLQVDSVEQLADLRTVEAAIGHIATPARRRGSIHARQAVGDVEKVARADAFDLHAIGDADRSRVLAQAQAQSRAGFHGAIELQPGLGPGIGGDGVGGQFQG